MFSGYRKAGYNYSLNNPMMMGKNPRSASMLFNSFKAGSPGIPQIKI